MAEDLVQIEIPVLDDTQVVSPPVGSSGNSHVTSPSSGTGGTNGQLDAASGGPTSGSEAEPSAPETAAAEYALHILFTQFVRYAERKLAAFSQVPEDSVEKVLGEGVDEEFDTILESLGHVARRKPKPVIDSVMYWRKSKKTGILPSIFILSRVLMEVVKQTPASVLGEDLCDKLEDIVSRQVQIADANVLSTSLARQANWRIMAKLLGEMSAFRFASVSDRFTEELEKGPDGREGQVILSLEAMPYLKLALYPEDHLEDTAIFIDSLAKFGAKAPLSLRPHYTKAIVRMLSPLAERATVEVNQPTWAAAIRRLYNLGMDKRQPSLQLCVISLCLAPAPFFAEHWLPLLESYAHQKNSKSRKASLYMPAAQLSYIYVFRCPESLNAMTRKIEELRKLLVAVPGRKHWQSLDETAKEGCVALLRVLFHAYKQHTLDELLFPMLVGADSGQITRQPQSMLDQIIPERAVLAIRAFSLAMQDLRSGSRPHFPIPESDLLDTKRPEEIASEVKQSELKASPEISPPLRASIDLFCECISQIALWLSSEPRTSSVSSQLIAFTSSAASAVGGAVGSGSSALLTNAAANNTLLAVALQSWSAWWPLGEHVKHLDILCRFEASHGSPGQQAALQAVRELSLQPLRDLRVLLGAHIRILMNVMNGQMIEPFLKVYVELVEAFVKWLQSENDISEKSQSLWPVVEEIEGNGLFFVCSRDRAIRSLGLRVLYLTTEMDSVLIGEKDQKPSRVIDYLQNTEIAPLVEGRLDLSAPERARVARFMSRKGASVARLAVSDYGVDAALWLKLFPKVAALCFDAYPIPVALCRSLACDRLVAMHSEVAQLMDSPSREGLPIAEQWRLYLMLVCATLTSTEEQKIHVPTHSRKKSIQRVTLHHQRITSAKSVFRIAAPMLGAAHSGIRDAAIAGMACTNVNTYRTLLECLEPLMTEETPRANTSAEAARLLTGAVEVLRQTAGFLNLPHIRDDPWIRDELTTVMSSLKTQLSFSKSYVSTYTSDLHSLRRVYCGLLADVYKAIGPQALFGGVASEWSSYWTLVESWSPFGSHAAAVAQRTASARSSNDDAVALAQLEIEKRDFDRATSRALAALLENSTGFITDIGPVLHYIHALISRTQPQIHESGILALQNLIRSYPSSEALAMELAVRCYPTDPQAVSSAYFCALVDVIQAKPEILSEMHEPLQFLTLAIFKVGDYDRNTRVKAAELVHSLEPALFNSSVVRNFQFRLRSPLPAVYKGEIFKMSQALASAHSEVSPKIFFFITKAFHLVTESSLRDILSVLLPWIQNIELCADAPQEEAAVLATLLEMTVVFGSKMQNEIEALWVALCTHSTWGERNSMAVMDFLLGACLHYRSVGFIELAKTVMIYLQGSLGADALVERLLGYLKPQYAITQSANASRFSTDDDDSKALDRVATLAKRPDEQFLPPLSYNQVAMCFLIDTLTESHLTAELVPLLLHVSITTADHFVPFLQASSRKLLLNVAGMAGMSDEAMAELCGMDSTLKWAYEDDVGRVPVDLAKLVEFCAKSVPGDLTGWPTTAIQWAVSCPARHIACRSFQVLRCLGPTLDQKMLSDMLARLSTTIAESAADIQGFAVQILMTLNAIVDQMAPEILMKFPHLFWVTVASLSTTNEREYIEALSIMSKLFTKLDWTKSEALRESYPARWDGVFVGVLPLLLQGLRSANSYAPCQEVIDQLILTPPESSDILLGEDAHPLILAAYLPRLLHAMDDNVEDPDSREAALSLSQIVTDKGFVRILDSFGRGRFWNKTDLLNQYVLSLTRAYPESVSSILVLLMSTLSNKLPWVKLETLSILRILLPEVNLQQGHLAHRGADIVSPLLRLLQTRYAEQALGVLDNAGAILAGKMDRHILRMSLGSRQYLKEYENTATLYGIPEESGWAVPNPAQLALRTRNNVHAVFYTCDASAASSETVELTPATEQLQFQADEYPGDEADVSFGAMDRMLTVLDDLDSFFTKVSGSKAVPETSPNSPLSRSTSEPEGFSVPQFYDKKVSMILNRSLGRNPSQVSFRTSFADSAAYQHSLQRSIGGSSSRFEHHIGPEAGPNVAPSIQRTVSAGSSSMVSLESFSTIADHTPPHTAAVIAGAFGTAPGSDLWAKGASVASSSHLDTPTHQRALPQYKTTVSIPKSPKSQAESSFRLESLLRGKRKSKKAEKEKRRTPEPTNSFQFP